MIRIEVKMIDNQSAQAAPASQALPVSQVLPASQAVPVSQVVPVSTAQILAAIKEHDIDGAIVKIIYHIPDDSVDKVDLYAVQNACSKAMCLASITPIRKHVVHERRIKVNVSMDFASIVEKYLESKDDLKVDKCRLKEKAFQLYHEVSNELTNN
jgi:hypothetical protein